MMALIGLAGWVAVISACLVLLVISQILHFSWVMGWNDRQTRRLAYYGLSRPQRQRFKRRLHLHARLLSPLLHCLARGKPFCFADGTFHYHQIAGPKGTCSQQSFAAATQYAPRREDLFVVTQMKSGTTWMQHLVFQILTQGRGDLAQSGICLNAISPWLESFRTVTVEEAPLVGVEQPQRIIKTHLPSTLCPYRPWARYIYVIRNPLSCFASCVDFLRSNLGPFAPSLETCQEWFCTPELMWFSPWPQHVSGWWRLAQQAPNVLLVHFEDMKDDLEKVAWQVNSWLELPDLSVAAMQAVVDQCRFETMRRHADLFEMQPPHLLQHASDYFISGQADRFRDLPAEIRGQLDAWCRQQLAAEGMDLSCLRLPAVGASK